MALGERSPLRTNPSRTMQSFLSSILTPRPLVDEAIDPVLHARRFPQAGVNSSE